MLLKQFFIYIFLKILTLKDIKSCISFILYLVIWAPKYFFLCYIITGRAGQVSCRPMSGAVQPDLKHVNSGQNRTKCSSCETYNMTSTKSFVTKSMKNLLFKKNYSVLASKPQCLWTKDNIVKSPFKEVDIPNVSIIEYVWRDLSKWENKTAVVCAATNKSYSYHDLYKRSRCFGVNLRIKLKVQHNDVIFVMMPNCPEYIVSVLGILEAGAQLTTCNPIYTAYEVQRQVLLSDPKVLIGTSETVSILKEALVLAKKDISIIVVKTKEGFPSGCVLFDELVADQYIDFSILNEVQRLPGNTAVLPYSSGTTGLPKGVELTHRNIVANCVQQSVENIKQYNDTTSNHQDSALAVMPFYHIYGLVIIMLHKLAVGAKLVTLPRFHPNTFLPTLKQHEINILFAAPPMVLFLGSHEGVTKDHLESVNIMVSGGAPLPKSDIDRVLEKSPKNVDFVQVYGLTETAPLATTVERGSTNYTTVGYPISNTDLKIVDSNLNTLGSNEVGELFIRGPQVMKGYRNNPEATNEVLIGDGWFRSGDLAKISDSGEVTIADRLKELIKVKGFQVPPAELENVLKEHPSVLDAAVVGAPHEKTGEVPKGFVVIKKGLTVKPEDIIEFVKTRVAEFKQIKDIIFVENIPRNPSGKMLRRVLKEKYC